MNPTSEDIVQRVVLKPDEGAAQATVKTIEGVKTALAGVKTEGAALGLQFNSVAQAAATLGVSEAALTGLTTEERTATAQAKELKVALDDASRSAKSVSTGGGINIGSARQAVGQAGGLLSAVGAGSAGSAVSSVLALTSSLGAVGVVAGTVAAGLNILRDNAAQAELAVKQRADTEKQVAQIIRTATRDQLQARLEASQQDLSIEKELLRQRQLAFAQYNTEIAGDPIALGAALAGLDGKYNGLKTAMLESGASVSAAELMVNVLTEAYNNNATAANDAAAAIEARTKAELAGVDIETRAQGMTKAQRDERIAQDMRELAGISQHIRANDLSAEAQAELVARSDELYAEINLLSGITTSYADTLEREQKIKQALTDSHGQYLDALALEGKVRDELAQTVAEIARIASERDARIAEITSEGEERRGEIIADAAERRAEIEADASERMQQIATDSAARIAKIMRDSGREQFAAIASRDALAFYQSQIRTKDALDDQREADEKALDQLVKAQAKQLAALDKSQAKQLEALEKSQAKQVSQAIAAGEKQIAVQRETQQQLQVDLQNAVAAQRAISLSGSAQVVSQHNQMYLDLATAAFNGGKSVVQSFINGMAAASTTLPSVSGTAAGTPGGGGYGAALDRRIDARLKSYYNAAGYR